MDIRLRIFVMIISCLVFYTVISKLIKRQLNESNSILWLLIGFITFISGFFPNLINRLAGFVGIDYPPTLLFLVSTIILMLITFKDSIDISKTESRLSEIAINLSILKEENNRLKKIIEDKAVFDNNLNNISSEICTTNYQTMPSLNKNKETNEGSDNI